MTIHTVFDIIRYCSNIADLNIIRTTQAADYAQCIAKLYTLGVADYSQTDKCFYDLETALELKRIELIGNLNLN
jgi:hypothetical protein